MNSPILSNQRKNEYSQLVDDIKGTITEAVFASRWALIEGHWNIGKLIREFSDGEVTKLLHDIAVDTGMSQRLLWDCLKCYDTFHTLDKIPEGKNISWNKLRTNYLVTKTPEPKQEPYKEYRCPMCKFVGGLEDFEK